MVIADAYTVSSSMVIFSFTNIPTASISLSANGIHANIQGTEDHIPIKKVGVHHTLNWLVKGFGPDDRLVRLVVELPNINLSNLYQHLSSMFERSSIPLVQIPPSYNQEKP